MRARVTAFLTALVIASAVSPGCGGKSRCTKPGDPDQHDRQPARQVTVPRVPLDGIFLGMTAAEARDTCVASGGTPTSDACERGDRRVSHRIDEWGRITQLVALPIALERRDQAFADAAAAIDRALGTADAGSPSQGDTRRSWNVDGGVLDLEAEQTGAGFALALGYAHREMTEQVTLGLPTCP